ncbi:hypothetical protein PLANTIT3_60199 [Plantibacter sp. T3]|nr:hypothetical protein PLANTIT3_60199 [Plantibacter sp. T3]
MDTPVGRGIREWSTPEANPGRGPWSGHSAPVVTSGMERRSLLREPDFGFGGFIRMLVAR